MSTSGVLETEDLLKITKLTRPGDVKRCLTRQGIKVFDGRDGAVWTTLDLINKAGGIKTPVHNEDFYDTEQVIG